MDIPAPQSSYQPNRVGANSALRQLALKSAHLADNCSDKTIANEFEGISAELPSSNRRPVRRATEMTHLYLDVSFTPESHIRRFHWNGRLVQERTLVNRAIFQNGNVGWRRALLSSMIKTVTFCEDADFHLAYRFCRKPQSWQLNTSTFGGIDCMTLRRP